MQGIESDMEVTSVAPPSLVSPRARLSLLTVNFFVETNRMEAFLGVNLMTFQSWDVVSFGHVSAILNIVMLFSQTPSGMLLDWTPP